MENQNSNDKNEELDVETRTEKVFAAFEKCNKAAANSEAATEEKLHQEVAEDNDNAQNEDLPAPDPIGPDNKENQFEAECASVHKADDLHPSQMKIATPIPDNTIRQRLNNRALAPYVCNICLQFVRCGVITICGHLYCWVCLWPALASRSDPKCPSCRRRLILHEDIVPFHGEGPNAKENDSNSLAMPGSVPRPRGFFLTANNIPDWFAVNDFEHLPEIHVGARNLYNIIISMQNHYPRLLKFSICLNWLQLICAVLMFLLWAVAIVV